MLTNDTWFMYGKGELPNPNNDGFGTLNAAGTLEDVRASCVKETEGVYACQKKKNGKPRLPAICNGKINACMKRRAKLTTKLGEASQADAITDTLKADVNEQNAVVAAKVSEGEAASSDMTLYYVIGGVAILAVATGAFFLLRKSSVAPVAS